LLYWKLKILLENPREFDIWRSHKVIAINSLLKNIYDFSNHSSVNNKAEEIT
jgi:hypothetical protein